MKIYCTQCNKDVEARLTNGEEIYPHRKDLYSIPFWKCDTCKLYVGCHHKSDTPTKPLGVFANQEIKDIRMKIHAQLDPLWKSGKYERNTLYSIIARKLGLNYRYHTGEIRTIEEGEKVLEIVKTLQTQQTNNI